MAARIVTLTRKYDSITPTMFKLHWLPVHSRIIFNLLLLVYKALKGKAPSYISSLLSHRKFKSSKERESIFGRIISNLTFLKVC